MFAENVINRKLINSLLLYVLSLIHFLINKKRAFN